MLQVAFGHKSPAGLKTDSCGCRFCKSVTRPKYELNWLWKTSSVLHTTRSFGHQLFGDAVNTYFGSPKHRVIYDKHQIFTTTLEETNYLRQAISDAVCVRFVALTGSELYVSPTLKCDGGFGQAPVSLAAIAITTTRIRGITTDGREGGLGRFGAVPLRLRHEIRSKCARRLPMEGTQPFPKTPSVAVSPTHLPGPDTRRLHDYLLLAQKHAFR